MTWHLSSILTGHSDCCRIGTSCIDDFKGHPIATAEPMNVGAFAINIDLADHAGMTLGASFAPSFRIQTALIFLSPVDNHICPQVQAFAPEK